MKTNLEEIVLKTIFNLIDYEKENFLEDGKEFTNSGQLLDFLEESFNDNDTFNDLGHTIIDWVVNNIEFIFNEYKNRPEKKVKSKQSGIPIKIDKFKF